MELGGTSLITSHLGADFDSFGSIIAASKLYSNPILLWPGSLSEPLTKFVKEKSKKYRIYFTLNDISKDFGDNWTINLETIVFADTRKESRLKHVHPVLEACKGFPKFPKVIVYDHHPPSDDDITTEYLFYRHIGSASSILTLEIMKRNEENPESIQLSSEEATIIALGIYQDTGCFIYNTTSKDDFQAAAYLMSRGMDLLTLQNFSTILHSSDQNEMHMNEDEFKAYQSLQDSAKNYDIKGEPIVIGEVIISKRVNFAPIVQVIMRERKIDTFFAIGVFDDQITVIGRATQRSRVDVGDVLKTLGGGGHQGAASAMTRDLTASQVRDELFASLISKVGDLVTVRDHMTKPPVFASSDKLTKEVSQLLLKFGLKKIPIVDPHSKHCIGIVDRISVEKAIAHGYEREPISHFMETEISVLAPNATFDMAVDLLLRKQQRIIPIVSEDELIGVLSRSDIISVLMKQPARFPQYMLPKPERDISNLVANKLGKFGEILKKFGEIGDSLKVEVFIVGGFIRDLFLDVPNDDIDLVISGDGIQYAEALLKQMGKKIVKHEEFKTAVVTLKDGLKIDVATARLEYYPQPVALPVVELSSLKMDLYRRDFSINAIAMQLNSNQFGKLKDFFNGEEDIKNKTVRVLHNLSFIEDPTRILRAVRFEQRYGFSISKHTEKLIRHALQLKVFDKLTGSRLFHEISKICEDKKPVESFIRMKQLSLWTAIHPTLQVKMNLDVLQKVHDVNKLYDLLSLKEKPVKWKLYLIAICAPLSHEECSQLMDRLLIQGGTKTEMTDMRALIKTTTQALKEWTRNSPSQNSKLYFILQPLQLELIIYLMSIDTIDDIRRHISLYLTSLQYIKLEVSGDDFRKSLQQQPGPNYKVVLKRVLESKLDGYVHSKEEQLQLAQQIFEELNKK